MSYSVEFTPKALEGIDNLEDQVTKPFLEKSASFLTN